MSLEEDIFEKYFQQLKDSGISLNLIDGLKKLWKSGDLTSIDRIQELINGELSNDLKN
jgi:hypothetical protein